MTKSIDLAIVIPVGPTCKMEFLLDTIASIEHYIHSKYQIILADDSQNPDNAHVVARHYPNVIVLQNSRNHGKCLGLYTSLCNAYAYALENFDFRALLRLDTDALITGHGPELQIIEYFANNPTVGLAGRYVKGLNSMDDFGNNWFNYGRGHYTLIAKLFTRFFFRNPIINWRIRKMLFKVIPEGFDIGELVFGGAYAFSRLGLEKLKEHGLLPMKNIIGPPLEEDHLLTLQIAYVGLGFGDLASGDGPFGCAWKGLPASPEQLYEANKKIIHSTRFWGDMKEGDIRKYFRTKREAHHRLVGLLEGQVAEDYLIWPDRTAINQND